MATAFISTSYPYPTSDVWLVASRIYGVCADAAPTPPSGHKLERCDDVRSTVSLLGLVSTVHTRQVVRMAPSIQLISTRNALDDRIRWDSTVLIEDDGGRGRLTERIDVEAGFWTLAAAAIARVYCRQQQHLIHNRLIDLQMEAARPPISPSAEGRHDPAT